VTFEPTPPGGGTLSARPGDMMSAPATPSPVSEPAVERPCILVAEDNAEMRRLISAALRARGYDVAEAQDGMELLDLIEAAARAGDRSRYAAVVSDVRMPWLTGMDVMAVLNVAAWSTPVILITAFGDEETHVEAQQLGAAAILDKPFEMEALGAALVRVLGERGR
jgi:DNA-binding response OmpR family regulator